MTRSISEVIGFCKSIDMQIYIQETKSSRGNTNIFRNSNIQINNHGDLNNPNTDVLFDPSSGGEPWQHFEALHVFNPLTVQSAGVQLRRKITDNTDLTLNCDLLGNKRLAFNYYSPHNFRNFNGTEKTNNLKSNSSKIIETAEATPLPIDVTALDRLKVATYSLANQIVELRLSYILFAGFLLILSKALAVSNTRASWTSLLKNTSNLYNIRKDGQFGPKSLIYYCPWLSSQMLLKEYGKQKKSSPNLPLSSVIVDCCYYRQSTSILLDNTSKSVMVLFCLQLISKNNIYNKILIISIKSCPEILLPVIKPVVRLMQSEIGILIISLYMFRTIYTYLSNPLANFFGNHISVLLNDPNNK